MDLLFSQVPTSKASTFFSFLSPLGYDIWLFVGGAFFMACFTLFTLARFTPYEWVEPGRNLKRRSNYLTNPFTISNSFWFITGTLLRQPSGINPQVELKNFCVCVWFEAKPRALFVLDFLFFETCLSFKVPTSQHARLFSFMNPLAMDIWLYVLSAYILVSITMFVVARFSPYEWHNPHPCDIENEIVENQFSFANSFWFTIGTLMQQGSDLNPKVP